MAIKVRLSEDGQYILEGIATPVDSEDAANKQYVDDAIANADDGNIDSDYGITIRKTADTTFVGVDTEVIADTEWVKDYVDSEGSLRYFKANSTLGDATAGGGDAVAAGPLANASGGSAIAVGHNAKAFGNDSITIGTQDSVGGGTDPNAIQSVAIGHGAKVFGNSSDSIAIGTNANMTNHSNSIALGKDATVTRADQMVIGGVQHVQTSEFHPTERREFLTVDTDGTWGFSDGELTYLDIDGTGNAANATGTETIALGPGGTTAEGNSSLAIGHNAQTKGQQAIAIGENTEASNTGSIAIGEDARAHGFQSIHIGTGDNNLIESNSLRGIALGHDSRIDSDASYGIAIGATAQVMEGDQNSIALGRGARTDTENQLTIGHINGGSLGITRIRTPGFTGGENRYIAVDSEGTWSVEEVIPGDVNIDSDYGITLRDSDNKTFIGVDTEGPDGIANKPYVNGEFADDRIYVLLNNANPTYSNNVNVGTGEAYLVQNSNGHTLIFVHEPHLQQLHRHFIKVTDSETGNYSIYPVKYTNDLQNGNAVEFVCQRSIYNSGASEVNEDAATFIIEHDSDASGSFSIGFGLTHDSNDRIVVDTESIVDTDYLEANTLRDATVSGNTLTITRGDGTDTEFENTMTDFGYQNLFPDSSELQRYPTTHDVGHNHFASAGSDIRWFLAQETVFDTDLPIGATIRVNFVSANPAETPDQEGYYSIFSLEIDSLDTLYTLNLEHIEGDDPLGDRPNALDTENHYEFRFSYENRAAGRSFNGHRSGYVAQPANRRDYEFLNGHGAFEEPKPWLKSEDETAAIATGDQSVALGGGAIAAADNTTAVGYGAQISNSAHTNSIVLGNGLSGDSDQLTIHGIDKIYTPEFHEDTNKIIQVDSDGHWSLVDESPDSDGSVTFGVQSIDVQNGARVIRTDTENVEPVVVDPDTMMHIPRTEHLSGNQLGAGAGTDLAAVNFDLNNNPTQVQFFWTETSAGGPNNFDDTFVSFDGVNSLRISGSGFEGTLDVSGPPDGSENFGQLIFHYNIDKYEGTTPDNRFATNNVQVYQSNEDLRLPSTRSFISDVGILFPNKNDSEGNFIVNVDTEVIADTDWVKANTLKNATVSGNTLTIERGDGTDTEFVAGGAHARSVYIEAANGDRSPLVYIKHNTDGTVDVHTVDSEYAGIGTGELDAVSLDAGGRLTIEQIGQNQSVPFDTSGEDVYVVTDTYTVIISGSPDNTGNDPVEGRTLHEWDDTTIVSGSSTDYRTKSVGDHTLVSIHTGKLGFTMADTDWIETNTQAALTAGDGININNDTEIEVDTGYGLTFDSQREVQVDISKIATHSYVDSAVRNATRGELGNRTNDNTLYLHDTETDRLRFRNHSSQSDNHSFIANNRGATVYQGVASDSDDLMIIQITDGSEETVNADDSRNWEAVQYSVYEGNTYDNPPGFMYHANAYQYTGANTTTVFTSQGSGGNVTFYRNGHNSSSLYQVTGRVQLGIVDDLSHVRTHDDFILIAESEEFEIDLPSGQSQVTESPLFFPAEAGAKIQPNQYVAVRWAIHVDHFDDNGITPTDSVYLVWSGTGSAQTHDAGRADVSTLTYETYLDPATGELKYGNNTKSPELIHTIVDTDGYYTNEANPFFKVIGDTGSPAVVSNNTGAIAIGEGATVQNHNDAIAIGRGATVDKFHQMRIGRIREILMDTDYASDSDYALATNKYVQENGGNNPYVAVDGTTDATVGNNTNGIAVGSDAEANTTNSIAIGNIAHVDHEGSIVIGNNTSTTQADEFVVGNVSSIRTPSFRQTDPRRITVGTDGRWTLDRVDSEGYGIDIDSNRVISIDTDEVPQLKYIAVPSSTSTRPIATGDDSIAIGPESTTGTAVQAVAIGTSSNASNRQSTAIGYLSDASGDRSVSIGYSAGADPGFPNGERALSIGAFSRAASNSTAMGVAAQADSDNAYAMGRFARAQGTHSFSMGRSSLASGAYSIAIGSAQDGDTATSATASHNYSVAIGQGATTSQDSEVVFGSITQIRVPSNYVVGSDNVLATKEYVDDNGGNDSLTTIEYTTADVSPPTVTNIGIGLGYGASSNGFRAIAIGQSTNDGQDGANATGTNAVAIGHSASTNGSNAVAIGAGANTSGTSSIAIGNDAEASNTDAIAIGHDATSTHSGSVAIGDGSSTTTTGQLSLSGLNHVLLPTFNNGSRPTNANSTAGMIGFNTTTNTLQVFNGTEWQNVQAN